MPLAGCAQVKQAADLGARLQAELQHALAADSSLPGILVTARAPLCGLDWAGAVTRDGEARQTVTQAFRIASVTKIFTAAAVMRLVEQGRIGLFSPVAPLLSPESCDLLAGHGFRLSAITIYHLLTHTAGLHDHAGPDSPYGATCLAQPHRVWTRQAQIALGLSLGLPIAPPGTHFSYSDTGYVLLGEVIERATGLALGPAFRGLLGFERLGLDQTYWELVEPVPAGQVRAAQYVGTQDVAGIHASCDLFGGGGLVSTTGDLVTFLRSLLRGEVFEHPRTLAAALMTPSVTFTPPAFLHSALLRGGVFAGRQCWSHGGFWGVQLVDIPDLDVTLALSFGQVECAASTSGSDGNGSLADRLVSIIVEYLSR